MSSTRMAVVGGFTDVGVLGDLWIFTLDEEYSGGLLHGRWNQLDDLTGQAFPGLVFARGYHSLVFDNRSSELIVFGGTSLQLSEQSDFGTVWTLYPGCNQGQFSNSIAIDGCAPCPNGTYADGAGFSTCLSCPSETTTTGIGAIYPSNCSICVPGTCHHRGTCTVNNYSGVHCDCGVFYGGAGNRCEALAWYWVFLATLAAVCPVLFLLLRYLRRIRRTAKTLEEENEQSAKVVRDLVNVSYHFRESPCGRANTVGSQYLSS